MNIFRKEFLSSDKMALIIKIGDKHLWHVCLKNDWHIFNNKIQWFNMLTLNQREEFIWSL